MDSGWAKKSVWNDATTFKDQNSNNKPYISVQSGTYKGYYLGGHYDNGIGAYRNWDDAGYMEWWGKECPNNGNRLLSQSGKTEGYNLVYRSNGYFYFYSGGGDYSDVCINKLYNKKNEECKADTVTGGWVYKFSLAAETEVVIKYGTQKSYEESKKKEGSNSVSVKIQQSFNIVDGIAGTQMEVGAELRIAFESAYKTEWIESTEKTMTVKFPAVNIGKSVWQFQVNITDSCQHVERTHLVEYALTDSRNDSPCCFPGYSADGPFHNICISETSLIDKKRKGKGCSVEKKDL